MVVAKAVMKEELVKPAACGGGGEGGGVDSCGEVKAEVEMLPTM